MKNVTPNIVDMVTNRYISGIGRLRKFKRKWGTQVVNGVEVFQHRHYFYPNMDDHTKELAKFLGIYSNLSKKQEGIRSAWLFLNPENDSTTAVAVDRNTLVRNLNKAIDYYKKLTVGTITLGPKQLSKGFIPPVFTASIADKEAFKQEFVSRYTEFWDNGYFITANEEDSYMEVLLYYILKSNEIPYIITDVTETLGEYVELVHGRAWRRSIKQYKVFINIPEKVYPLDGDGNPIVTPVFTTSSDIVDMIVNDLVNKKDKPATKLVMTAIRSASASDIPNYNPDPNNLPVNLNYEAMPITLSDLWYKFDGKTYLKTSILSISGMKIEDRIKYLYNLIDSDYKKKKIKWYEYAIAVVAIVVISYFTAGTASAAAAAAFTSTMMVTVTTVAIAITLAAMYISLAIASAYLLGMTGVAAAMGTFLKQVAPLVKVAQIISYVVIVVRIVQVGIEMAAKKAAEEAAKKGAQAAAVTIADISLKDIAIEISKLAVQEITGIPATGDLNMNHVAKMLNISFGLYQDYQLKQDMRALKKLQNQLAEEQAAIEQSNTSDLAKDMMRVYPNPLSMDHSHYADLYDKPYEWWSTEYHTGNIQQTTVIGAWST